jgi:hypothetical protein
VSELSIVIPSWNTRELLARCLASIDAAQMPDTEVIVVDNASADGSADMVAARFPRAQLVRNAENEGFARGCNQGMRMASGEALLLLNADTEIEGTALVDMLAFLRAHPEHGAVAPRLVNPDGTTQRACMRFPGLWTPLFFGTPLERWLPRSRELERYFLRDWDHGDERDVDQPPAACLMLRRAALDEVGLFDEDLWLFFNDVDLSLRLARAGWKTRYLHGARVVHHHGKSTAQFPRRVAEWQKNRLAYYRKHHGRLAGVWVKACVLFAWLDFALANTWARMRSQPYEPIGPTSRAFGEFLRQ